MDWRKSEGHLVNVWAGLLPGSDKNVLGGVSGSSGGMRCMEVVEACLAQAQRSQWQRLRHNQLTVKKAIRCRSEAGDRRSACLVGQHVLARGQGLQVAHEQAYNPEGVLQVQASLAALGAHPLAGNALYVQQVAAVHTHLCYLQHTTSQLSGGNSEEAAHQWLSSSGCSISNPNSSKYSILTPRTAGLISV